MQAVIEKESLTGIETEVQIEERTRHAMENYFNWLHSAILASPWSNDLNKKLLNYATENVAAAVGLVQKLSQAKDVEQVVKIQTEFMSKQLGSLNEQTKTILEICTKAAQDMTKRSS
jgi:hypothetical protein